LVVLQTVGLTKVYGSRSRVVTQALTNFTLEVEQGEFVGSWDRRAAVRRRF